MRTTLDIEKPILDEIKALQRKEKRTIGEIVSTLLADALRNRKDGHDPMKTEFRWFSKPMQAKVDISDKEALHDAMESK